MPLLDIPQNNLSGEVPTQQDLDDTFQAIETFFNVTKLDDYNLQDVGITASDKFIDGTVSTAKLVTSAVTAAKILASNVTTAKFNDSAVTTAKINDLAVTTGKISDSAVTTAKINDGAVTKPKITLNRQTSGSSGTISNSSSSEQTVVQASITTTGRPVLIMFHPIGGGSTSYLEISINISDAHRILLYRDSTLLGQIFSRSAFPSGTPGVPSPRTLRYSDCNMWIDTPSAGSYTYSIKQRPSLSPGSLGVTTVNYMITVMEL